MNFLRAVSYTVTTLSDAYFAGIIWRCESADGLHTHLQFERRANFLRYVRVLHTAWISDQWYRYATAVSGL